MGLIHFEPLQKKHLRLLHLWLNDLQVKPWYDPFQEASLENIQKKYLSYTQGYKQFNGTNRPIQAVVSYQNKTPFGYIQLYNAFDFPREGYDLHDYIDYAQQLGAIDFFIGNPNFRSKGYGSLLLEQFIYEIAFKKFNRIIVDPEVTNIRAIKCYEKVGFKKIIYIPTAPMTYSSLMIIEREK